MPKMISWNVNGIRACMGKGFMDFFLREDADIFCIQETKVQDGQIEVTAEGYYQYWNYAEKKGYSGVAVFSKAKPISVAYGIGLDEHDKEGRVLTLEFDEYYVVTVYTPNSQRGLTRLEYRMKWEDDFIAYLKSLEKDKPVIACGDFNVAHREIDLKNPQSNRKNAGFTNEERGKFDNYVNTGLVDTFRYLYPDKTEVYTWWSYMFNARQNNAGWRIDYFIVSDNLKGRLEDSLVYSDVMGSDHCPVGILLG